MAQQKIEYTLGDQGQDLEYAADATGLGGASVVVIFADGLSKQERAIALQKLRLAVMELDLPNA